MNTRTAKALIRIRLASLPRRMPWHPVILTENQIYKRLKRDVLKYKLDMDEQAIRSLSRNMARSQNDMFKLAMPEIFERDSSDEHQFRFGGYGLMGVHTPNPPHFIFADGI